MSEAHARGVGGRQLQSIEACWGHLCRHLSPELDPAAVTYDVVTGFVAARRKEGVRGQSIRKELQALKRALAIAHRRGSLDALPTQWPKLRADPPRQWQRGKLHPPEVIQAWLARLAEQCPEAHRQAQVGLRTGLRAEELRALTWDWVESAPAGTGVPALLRVPAEAAKTRRERVLGLTPECLGWIEDARDTGSWDAPLFAIDHRKSFSSARKAIGYKKTITLRDLRHCHATWATQGTGDAAAAQAALGHSDLRTTQRYLTATVARTAGAAVAVADRLAASISDQAVSDIGHSGWTQSAVTAQKKTSPATPKGRPGQHSRMVGETGFEPATLCSQSRCATRLRYSPKAPNTNHYPANQPRILAHHTRLPRPPPGQRRPAHA